MIGTGIERINMEGKRIKEVLKKEGISISTFKKRVKLGKYKRVGYGRYEYNDDFEILKTRVDKLEKEMKSLNDKIGLLIKNKTTRGVKLV